MKSDIVLRIEKALKEYTPSKIDGVRIATARRLFYKLAFHQASPLEHSLVLL